MSAKFSLDDYVDVAERIREFSAKYPDGSLQGEGEFVRQEPRHGDDVTMGAIVGYIYCARAYRTPDDPRPGVGTAFEPIPGKTPYTRDSEVQNAETAAWGRAIVALGFETKKIASKQEVQNRQSDEKVPAKKNTPVVKTDDEPKPDNARFEEIDALVDELASMRSAPREQVLRALEETMGKPPSLYGDTEAVMAIGRLKAWRDKAMAA